MGEWEWEKIETVPLLKACVEKTNCDIRVILFDELELAKNENRKNVEVRTANVVQLTVSRSVGPGSNADASQVVLYWALFLPR